MCTCIYAIVLRLINSSSSLKKITFVMVFGNLISIRIHLSYLICPFSPYFQLRRYIKRSLFYFIYKKTLFCFFFLEMWSLVFHILVWMLVSGMCEYKSDGELILTMKLVSMYSKHEIYEIFSCEWFIDAFHCLLIMS